MIKVELETLKFKKNKNEKLRSTYSSKYKCIYLIIT